MAAAVPVELQFGEQVHTLLPELRCRRFSVEQPLLQEFTELVG
jgi:hypothetical protein